MRGQLKMYMDVCFKGKSTPAFVFQWSRLHLPDGEAEQTIKRPLHCIT